MILEFLPEITEKIFDHVPVGDLKRLACCSYDYYTLTKGHIWRTLNLREGKFAEIDWESFDQLKLKNLKYTQAVYIEVHSLNHYDDRSKQKKKNNFNTFFEHCKPNILYTTHFTKEILHNYIVRIKHLKELSLGCTNILDDDVILICESLPQLKVLRICRTEVGDKGISFVYKLECLEILEISGCRVSRDGLKSVARLKKLKDLYVSFCRNINDEDFEMLTPMRLDKLRLYATSAGDQAAFYISKMTSLKFLNIGNTDITDTGLEHLTCLKNMKVLLTENSTETITLRGIEMISTMSSLTKLELTRNINLTGSPGMFSGLCNLIELVLEGCTQFQTSSLNPFKQWLKLKKLILTNTSMTDALLSHISIKSLEYLCLKGNYHITDDGLHHLVSLQNLKELDLESLGEITVRGITNLISLEKIEKVSFRYCHLTDACVSEISKIRTIKQLFLTGNPNLSDKGIEELGQLINLEEIDISDCTSVTLFGVRALPPSVKVVTLSNTRVTMEQVDELNMNTKQNLQLIKRY